MTNDDGLPGDGLPGDGRRPWSAELWAVMGSAVAETVALFAAVATEATGGTTAATIHAHGSIFSISLVAALIAGIAMTWRDPAAPIRSTGIGVMIGATLVGEAAWIVGLGTADGSTRPAVVLGAYAFASGAATTAAIGLAMRDGPSRRRGDVGREDPDR